MSKIVVIGGAGFIGSTLVKKFTEEGHDVYVLDAFYNYINPRPVPDLSSYNMNYRFENLLKKAEILRCNIENKDDVRRKIEAIKPEYLVHCGALPLANIAIEHSGEAFESIVGATANLLEILRDYRHIKFIYISSSMVYGDFESTPMPEDGRKEPREIYGSMKIAGEYMVKAYAQCYGISYTIIRPSAVYGPTDNNQRVAGLFLTNAIQQRPIRLKNGESTYLDFTYVDDIAEGIKLATFSAKASQQTFNLTRGKGRSLVELGNIIQKLYPGTKIEAAEADAFTPKRGTLDISKAQQLLGYNPQIDLEDGIRLYAEFLETAFRMTTVHRE